MPGWRKQLPMDSQQAITRLNRWTSAMALGTGLTVAAYLITRSLWPYLLWCAGAFTWLTWQLAGNWRNGWLLGGPANWVTWIRLALTALLITIYKESSPLWLGALALGTLLLDAADGYLARRFGTKSLFGEYFDKEVDAAFVMTLTLLLYDLGQSGAWILLLGAIRYLYLIPDHFFKPKAQKDPRTPYARIIAGIVMTGLAAAMALPKGVNEMLLPGLGILLAYSFGRSFWELVMD